MNELRLLTPADIERTTAMMAQAFCRDPAWTYVVPQSQHRQATLARLFRGVIAMYIRHQQGYGVADPLQGVAIWSVPHQRRASPLGLLSVETFKLLLTPGMWPVLKRSLQLARATAALKKSMFTSHIITWRRWLLRLRPRVKGWLRNWCVPSWPKRRRNPSACI